MRSKEDPVVARRGNPALQDPPEPIIRAPTVSPPGEAPRLEDTGLSRKCLRILYLFAGVTRKSFVKQYLIVLSREHGFDLEFHEVDIIHSRNHNLAQKSKQRLWKQKVMSGEFEVLIVSPPCNSFSRAREMPNGPRPVRNRQFPRGLPKLTPNEQLLVKLGNTLADYACEAMHAQLQTGGMALMEHPEDLGRCPSGGVPAAIWQFAECNSLLGYPDVLTVVCYSQALGQSTSNPLGCWEGSPVWKPWVFGALPSSIRSGTILVPSPDRRTTKRPLQERPQTSTSEPRALQLGPH